MDYQLKIVNHGSAIRFMVRRISLVPKLIRAVSYDVYGNRIDDGLNVERGYGLPTFSIPEFKAYTIERYESVYGVMEIKDLT